MPGLSKQGGNAIDNLLCLAFRLGEIEEPEFRRKQGWAIHVQLRIRHLSSLHIAALRPKINPEDLRVVLGLKTVGF